MSCIYVQGPCLLILRETSLLMQSNCAAFVKAGHVMMGILAMCQE